MRLFEAIAETLTGHNVVAVFSELFTQASDVGVDSAVGHHNIRAPNVVDNLFARIDAVAVGQEEQEDVKLCASELDFFPSEITNLFVAVDAQGLKCYVGFVDALGNVVGNLLGGCGAA